MLSLTVLISSSAMGAPASMDACALSIMAFFSGVMVPSAAVMHRSRKKQAGNCLWNDDLNIGQDM